MSQGKEQTVLGESALSRYSDLSLKAYSQSVSQEEGSEDGSVEEGVPGERAGETAEAGARGEQEDEEEWDLKDLIGDMGRLTD